VARSSSAGVASQATGAPPDGNTQMSVPTPGLNSSKNNAASAVTAVGKSIFDVRPIVSLTPQRVEGLVRQEHR